MKQPLSTPNRMPAKYRMIKLSMICQHHFITQQPRRLSEKSFQTAPKGEYDAN